MRLVVFEDSGWRGLLPLTWLHCACELRLGRDTLLDKALGALGARAAEFVARPLLAEVLRERYPDRSVVQDDELLLWNARALAAVATLEAPPAGTAWCAGSRLVATRVNAAEYAAMSVGAMLDDAAVAAWIARRRVAATPTGVRLIDYPWELALGNHAELVRQLRDGGMIDGLVHGGAQLANRGAITINTGARIAPGAVLDASDGPIHIERDAIIQPNAVLIGPCYVGAKSIVRPTAVIREGTTIGPVCRVGGEVEASIFQGFSNKQHDGFLGHSFVAPWVNLGADTVVSDLKNTYGTIRVRLNGVETETGQRFLGSTLGDHAKTGIGTILPTGAIVGIGAQVFTRDAVPKFVPSFAWLTDDGLAAAHVDKVVEIAGTVMGRRAVALSAAETALLRAVAAEARQVERAGWSDA